MGKAHPRLMRAPSPEGWTGVACVSAQPIHQTGPAQPHPGRLAADPAASWPHPAPFHGLWQSGVTCWTDSPGESSELEGASLLPATSPTVKPPGSGGTLGTSSVFQKDLQNLSNSDSVPGTSQHTGQPQPHPTGVSPYK